MDYSYEASRDLITVVENKAGSTPTTVSKYDYGQGSGYDALARLPE